MKLSELVAFRNRLEELPVSAAERVAQDKLDVLMHQIAEQEKHWFQESYRVFEAAEDCEKTPQIFRGRTVIGTMSEKSILHSRKDTGAKSERTIESENTLRARLSAYADWRWPGMIIRPGLEDFIENMVGSDPVYIIDREHDLLQPCLDRFPQAYQNRLRSYTTNDWSDQPILSKIPNNQFGVCLACNVFNYRPLEIIRRYLEEIYTKLRPGGVLLMTYNDCDLAQAVMLAEQRFASYTPGYLIRDLTQNVGFELTYTWSDGGPSVWLELCKPGQLISNRGGQALAKIHNAFDYSDDIDFLKRKAYTKDEIVKLQNQANDLGINKKIIKRSEPYDLQVLITTITHAQYEADRIENEKKQLEKLQGLAKKHNVDITALDWRETLREVIRVKEEEELRIAQELHEEMAKSVDQRKREELVRLRQRAMELQAGDPNLIRYGYSAEKLKNLIKQKEEENK